MSSLSSDSPPADTGHVGDGLSVSQAAAYLGLSVNAVRHKIRRGTLPAVKVNGEWRVQMLEGMPPTSAASPRTGGAADMPEDRPEDTPPTYPVTAARQLEVIRDTLLRPLIEQNERQQAAIAEQAEALGRLEAERDQARQSAEAAIAARDQMQEERDELLTLRETLRVRLSTLEAQQAESPMQASSAPETATDAATGVPWWAFWKR